MPETEMGQATKGLRVGIIQCALPGPKHHNVAAIEAHVREAANRGAQLVLPPELFEGPYFPQAQAEAHFAMAAPVAGHPTLARFSALAKELGVAIPVSFFEQDGQHYYNSVVMFDADGASLGLYRKSHIPDGPGYSEKFYFKPGDTGFQVFNTRFGTIGVGICWDQWFPEAARCMTLLGADVLLYPTAIGSEPHEPDVDTAAPWRRAMQGHAVSNSVVVAAANRVGQEDAIRFYGTSFIADQRGEVVAELGRDEEGVAIADVDLEALGRYRASWGFFRDRRPELYNCIPGGRRD